MATPTFAQYELFCSEEELYLREGGYLDSKGTDTCASSMLSSKDARFFSIDVQIGDIVQCLAYVGVAVLLTRASPLGRRRRRRGQQQQQQQQQQQPPRGERTARDGETGGVRDVGEDGDDDDDEEETTPPTDAAFGDPEASSFMQQWGFSLSAGMVGLVGVYTFLSLLYSVGLVMDGQRDVCVGRHDQKENGGLACIGRYGVDDDDDAAAGVVDDDLLLLAANVTCVDNAHLREGCRRNLQFFVVCLFVTLEALRPWVIATFLLTSIPSCPKVARIGEWLIGDLDDETLPAWPPPQHRQEAPATAEVGHPDRVADDEEEGEEGSHCGDEHEHKSVEDDVVTSEGRDEARPPPHAQPRSQPEPQPQQTQLPADSSDSYWMALSQRWDTAPLHHFCSQYCRTCWMWLTTPRLFMGGLFLAVSFPLFVFGMIIACTVALPMFLYGIIAFVAAVAPTAAGLWLYTTLSRRHAAARRVPATDVTTAPAGTDPILAADEARDQRDPLALIDPDLEMNSGELNISSGGSSGGSNADHNQELETRTNLRLEMAVIQANRSGGGRGAGGAGDATATATATASGEEAGLYGMVSRIWTRFMHDLGLDGTAQSFLLLLVYFYIFYLAEAYVSILGPLRAYFFQVARFYNVPGIINHMLPRVPGVHPHVPRKELLRFRGDLSLHDMVAANRLMWVITLFVPLFLLTLSLLEKHASRFLPASWLRKTSFGVPRSPRTALCGDNGSTPDAATGGRPTANHRRATAGDRAHAQVNSPRLSAASCKSGDADVDLQKAELVNEPKDSDAANAFLVEFDKGSSSSSSAAMAASSPAPPCKSPGQLPTLL